MDVEYDLDQVRLPPSDNSLVRFQDLLPVADPSPFAAQPMPPTPCVHARQLGAHLGLPWLFLQDETRLPTGTTKYRMAVVSLAYLRECGVRAFCTSSTGNSSTAYAQAMAHYPDLRMFLFTAGDFQGRVDYGVSGRVTPFVLRGASFVDAFDCAGAFAARHGLVSERGFFNPGRREGLKLAFLEAAEQVPQPIDWYVQAVSSAMGVYGAYKGAKELLGLGRIARVPSLLCVQQQSCAPMVTAFAAGSPVIRPEDIVPRPAGIAQAILRGDPTRVYPYVRAMVLESGGTFVAVSEAEIREAWRMVEELEGISICFSASAAVAGLIRQARSGRIPPQETVLINLTGSERPPTEQASRGHWLVRCNGNDGWLPEHPDDPAAQAAWHRPLAAEVTP